MYTAQITVTSNSVLNSANPQFKVLYKNGNNWHESAPATVYVDNSEMTATSGGSNNSLLYVIGIIVVALVVIGGIFWFLRSKRAKK
jgi:LPXTG-motif cell wall-anchored protein